MALVVRGTQGCSPNSGRSEAFQDLSVEIPSTPLLPLFNSASSCGRSTNFSQGSILRKSSVQHLENLGCNNRIPVEQILFGSQRRPALFVLDQNSQSPSKAKDNKLAKHDNSGPSIVVEEVKEKLDEFKRENWGGFLGGNGCKLPLKRRRPPTLEIPQSPKSLDQSLPIVDLKGEVQKEINFEGCNYSVACKKGRREVIEDSYRAMTDISGDSSQAFFGVFDGHGGRKAADFASDNLGQNIVDAMSQLKEADDRMEQAVRSGYLTTDKAFSKQSISSGACCVTAMIADGHMVVANAGDCRAVLCVDANAESLTCDHRVERKDERQRIEDLGGFVDCRNGVWRVQGTLAVSRSIGDTHLKEWISAEPEMKKLKIKSNCEFLILASDGLWDKVSNQEAVDIIEPCISSPPSIVVSYVAYIATFDSVHRVIPCLLDTSSWDEFLTCISHLFDESHISDLGDTIDCIHFLLDRVGESFFPLGTSPHDRLSLFDIGLELVPQYLGEAPSSSKEISFSLDLVLYPSLLDPNFSSSALWLCVPILVVTSLGIDMEILEQHSETSYFLCFLPSSLF